MKLLVALLSPFALIASLAAKEKPHSSLPGRYPPIIQVAPAGEPQQAASASGGGRRARGADIRPLGERVLAGGTARQQGATRLGRRPGPTKAAPPAAPTPPPNPNPPPPAPPPPRPSSPAPAPTKAP